MAFTRAPVFTNVNHHSLSAEQTADILKAAVAVVLETLGASEIISPTVEAREKAAAAIRRAIHDRVLALTAADPTLRVTPGDEDQMAVQVIRQVFGLGFLEGFLPPARTDVQEIIINPDGAVWVWPKGGDRFELTPVRPMLKEVVDVLEKILGPLNRRVSFAEPIVNARLAASPRMPAGARVHVVGPPAVVTHPGYPAVNIRLFEEELIHPEKLLGWGVLTEEMAAFLRERVQETCGILVAGRTGSGKTTFLNFLSCFIPELDRVVTVEDTAELYLSSPTGERRANWVQMETRPPSIEGKGEIRFIDLVNASLRMTPQWVIVGEIRQGAVASALLQTQISGHGGMTTIHADNARKAVDTLVMRCMQTEEYKNNAAGAKDYIALGLDLVVHLGWVGAPGNLARRVTDVAMVEPQLRRGEVHLRYLYRYDQARSLQENRPIWKGPTELGAVYDRTIQDCGF